MSYDFPLRIGVGMLRDAIRRTLVISEQAGIRAMLTHPIDADAARFYQRFGVDFNRIGISVCIIEAKLTAVPAPLEMCV